MTAEDRLDGVEGPTDHPRELEGILELLGAEAGQRTVERFQAVAVVQGAKMFRVASQALEEQRGRGSDEGKVGIVDEQRHGLAVRVPAGHRLDEALTSLAHRGEVSPRA